MKPVVSVIIPVFNAEKYIHKCVDSILNQTYSNLEVILVDDGSKDKSPLICDEYARNYPNIQSFHQKNSGPSTARNLGLEKANGDYILFVDSDDFWMTERDLEVLLNHASLKDPSFDFLEFNRLRYIPSSNSYVKFPQFPQELEEIHDTDNVVIELVKKGIFPMSPCTKIIKRSFLIDNNIRFIEGIISEDSPWYMDLLLHSKHGIALSNYYMYGNRSEIANSRSTTFSLKKIKDVLWILDYDSKRVQESTMADNAKSALLSALAYKYILIAVLQHEHNNQVDKETRERIRDFEWLLKYDMHPKVKAVNKLRKYTGGALSFRVLSFYLKNRDKIKKIMK